MKTFLQYLAEMPSINTYHTKERMKEFSKPVMNYIKDNHKDATSLGDDHFHLKHKDTGADIYYHHAEGAPKEVSYINKGVQSGTDKNGGDVSHIHKFMLHHINTTGKLSSDSSNTEGSKHMWKSFIKKNPQLKYNAHNSKTNESTKITADNIEEHEHKIWGTHSKFNDIKLIAEK